MTRNGKIARLPRAVRVELNRRMSEGQQGKPLLAWLNGLPATRAVLAGFFGGAAVTKQNLSQWRLGGFADWELREEWRENGQDLAADVAELAGAAQTARQPNLTENLGAVVALRYAKLVMGWKEAPDEAFDRRSRALRRMVRDVTQLRRCDQRAARLAAEERRRRKARVEPVKQREDAGVKNARTAVPGRLGVSSSRPDVLLAATQPPFTSSSSPYSVSSMPLGQSPHRTGESVLDGVGSGAKNADKAVRAPTPAADGEGGDLAALESAARWGEFESGKPAGKSSPVAEGQSEFFVGEQAERQTASRAERTPHPRSFSPSGAKEDGWAIEIPEKRCCTGVCNCYSARPLSQSVKVD